MLGASAEFTFFAHTIEEALASAMVIHIHGVQGARAQLGDDAALLAAYVVFGLLRFPLFALLRLASAYEIPQETMTLHDVLRDVIIQDLGPSAASLDSIDLMMPWAMVIVGIGGCLNLSGANLEDRGAKAAWGK